MFNRALWVFEDAPPAQWPAGYDHALVKLADGQATSAGGFDFAANYRQWVGKFGGERVSPWIFVYPGDGNVPGNLFYGNAPTAPYWVFDVEDPNGAHWTDQQLRDLIGGATAHRTSTAVGYSSYPTRAQCAQHGINQALLDSLTGFALPQVYYDYQAAELAQVLKDHHSPVFTLSPGDDAGWVAAARTVISWGKPLAWWRYGLAGSEGWAGQVPAPVVAGPVAPAGPDPLKPTEWAAWPSGTFVAWDGQTWWVTDSIVRRAASQQMAQGLVSLGMPVRWWPHVAFETALVKVGQ